MTHYQNLATLAFRSIGVMVIIFSLIPLIYLFVMDTPAKYTFFYFTALPGLFVGIVLFVSSRVLAKLVCFDFDKSDD